MFRNFESSQVRNIQKISPRITTTQGEIYFSLLTIDIRPLTFELRHSRSELNNILICKRSISSIFSFKDYSRFYNFEVMPLSDRHIHSIHTTCKTKSKTLELLSLTIIKFIPNTKLRNKKPKNCGIKNQKTAE